MHTRLYKELSYRLHLFSKHAVWTLGTPQLTRSPYLDNNSHSLCPREHMHSQREDEPVSTLQ